MKKMSYEDQATCSGKVMLTICSEALGLNLYS